MAGPTGDGCPSCGAPIQPLAARCETCGYGFGSVARNIRSGDPRKGQLVESTNVTRSGGIDREVGPCERCGNAVALGATYCRHCGHTARQWRVVPVILMILGFCLTASIIGAVVGIPMQVLALRMFRESREGSVVAT